MHLHLDHIAKRGSVRLENGNDVIKGLLLLPCCSILSTTSPPWTGSIGPVALTKMKSPARHPWE